MDFAELVKARQSDRAYLDKAVEREKIEAILEAGRLAPSASNAQGWTFVVIDDGVVKARVAQAMHRMGGAFVREAPVVIAIVAEKPLFFSRLGSAMRKIDFASLDVGIAAAHICLQAADMGLGTCMVESFDESKLKAALAVPDDRRIALLISVGYSGDPRRDKKRKPAAETVRWNGYDRPSV